MYFLETQGTWFEIGEQTGKQLREPIQANIKGRLKGYSENPEAYKTAIQRIHNDVQKIAPELIDEIRGVAKGTDMSFEDVFAMRFSTTVQRRANPCCSVVYLTDSNVGPIMGRNNDGGLEEKPDTQMCQIVRPNNAPARIVTGYVGMQGCIGFNENGLCFGTSSAHTDESHSDDGLPASVHLHTALLKCHTVKQAAELLTGVPFFGKSCNAIAGDTNGESILFEFVSGKPPIPTPRRTERDWQCCTNFFTSGKVSVKPEPGYLYNAYARYGRQLYQLNECPMPRTLDSLKALMQDLAQPGDYLPEHRINLSTLYSQIFELNTRTMHVWPGHPAKVECRSLSLS